MGRKLVLVLPGKGVCETNSPSAFTPFLHPIVRSLEPWLWQRLAVFFGGHAASSRCFTGFQATQQTGELITWPDSTSTQDSSHHQDDITFFRNRESLYIPFSCHSYWVGIQYRNMTCENKLNVDFQKNCSPQLLGNHFATWHCFQHLKRLFDCTAGPVRCWNSSIWRCPSSLNLLVFHFRDIGLFLSQQQVATDASNSKQGSFVNVSVSALDD